ncbi:EamA family transporter RarD [Actinospongicola halichondriae]|uniref:EamA family transporter RarD n=1 Tax=Actinospongicola halichondriae TaxID=3236844 RepID=UPI003D4FA920
MDDQRQQRIGMVAGFCAYGLWGVFPLVFNLIDEVAPLEILFHRIAWSLVVVLAVLGLQRRFPELRAVLRSPRLLRILAAAAVFISVNWLTYIWAVNNEHVVDAALGYYVNPLITVALGVVVLGEHLRRAQKIALGFGAAAVIVLTVANGRVPWIALVLACSFATYGYLKKSADVAALPSLAVETAVLSPIAVIGLAVFQARGDLSFAHGTVGRDAILVGLGVVTAVPLLLFATAATRIPLSMLGLLQYVTPTLQLLCGVLILDEDLPPERLAGFVLVWLALTILGTDAIGNERRIRREAALAATAT